MPYNTTAIPPRKEVTGQTQLPLSRVKKIITADPGIEQCSNNAAFMITVAAEMFVQYLASEGQRAAKAERKPRRNIQYKDIASAVSNLEHLEFLQDVVPKTAPYKRIKDQAADTRSKLRVDKFAEDGGTANGARKPPLANGSSVNGVMNSRDDQSEDPNDQLEMEMRQAEQDQDVDMED